VWSDDRLPGSRGSVVAAPGELAYVLGSRSLLVYLGTVKSQGGLRMPTTPKLLLPYPAANDPADVPTDMRELAERIEVVSPFAWSGPYTATMTAPAPAGSGTETVIVAHSLGRVPDILVGWLVDLGYGVFIQWVATLSSTQVSVSFGNVGTVDARAQLKFYLGVTQL
jgi:hypothetical protein